MPHFPLIALFLLKLKIYSLQILAPALRACFPTSVTSDSQFKCFSDVSHTALLAAVDASVELLKQQLLRVHLEVKEAVRAKQQLSENGLGKFSIRKMATGSIDDFHKGLADRIGEKKPAHLSRSSPTHAHLDAKLFFLCAHSERLLFIGGRFAQS